jgi:hypothetical protein
MLLSAILAAATATSAPALRNAETCILTEAPRVEALEPSLAAGSALLVDWLCAPEIEAAARYAENKALADALPTLTPEMRAKSVDPVTGELLPEIGTPPPSYRSGAEIFYKAPAIYRKLATDRLLAARAQRAQAK